MVTKLFEIRDSMTCIAAMAVQLDPRTEDERYLLARSGYGRSAIQHRGYVLLTPISGGKGEMLCDEYGWSSRTMSIAHSEIKDRWDKLETGDVIDVEFILGETKEIKQRERLEMSAC